MEFLKIDNFSFAYPGQDQAALRGVSLTGESLSHHPFCLRSEGEGGGHCPPAKKPVLGRAGPKSEKPAPSG